MELHKALENLIEVNKSLPNQKYQNTQVFKSKSSFLGYIADTLFLPHIWCNVELSIQFNPLVLIY